MNNATFFKAGNKNYITGADTALAIDGLTAAEVTFMDQVDADGKPIGIMPASRLRRWGPKVSPASRQSACPPRPSGP